MSKAKRPLWAITITEWAAEFGVARKTAHRWAAQGRAGPITRLPGSRTALLDRRELERLGYLKPRADQIASLIAEAKMQAVAHRDKQWMAAITALASMPRKELQ